MKYRTYFYIYAEKNIFANSQYTKYNLKSTYVHQIYLKITMINLHYIAYLYWAGWAKPHTMKGQDTQEKLM